jgi:predicted nucleic acid-binding protein
MPLIVVYDANVLYAAPLRDTLLELAKTELFQVKWSRDIHREWMRNLLENRPDLTKEQLEYTQQQMDKALPDALVTRYSHLTKTLTLPDPDDRHVLAVALRIQATLIVTKNLKDFPSSILGTHGVQAVHPDNFIMQLANAQQERVLEALEKQRQRLRNPAKTKAEFLETLQRQELFRTADWYKTVLNL